MIGYLGDQVFLLNWPVCDDKILGIKKFLLNTKFSFRQIFQLVLFSCILQYSCYTFVHHNFEHQNMHNKHKSTNKKLQIESSLSIEAEFIGMSLLIH